MMYGVHLLTSPLRAATMKKNVCLRAAVLQVSGGVRVSAVRPS